MENSRLAENSHYKQKPSLKYTCSKPHTHAQSFLLSRHYSYTSVTLETTSPKVPCVQDAKHGLFAVLDCSLSSELEGPTQERLTLGNFFFIIFFFGVGGEMFDQAWALTPGRRHVERVWNGD